jgi:hypothetical protein
MAMHDPRFASSLIVYGVIYGTWGLCQMARSTLKSPPRISSRCPSQCTMLVPKRILDGISPSHDGISPSHPATVRDGLRQKALVITDIIRLRASCGRLQE